MINVSPGLVNVNIDETVEMLGPCLLVQKRAGHRLTTDSLLLADFAAAALSPSRLAAGCSQTTGACGKNLRSIVDIGTGNGAIAIMLALRINSASFVGIEVQNELVELTRRNITANRLDDTVSVEEIDYRELPLKFKAGSVSLVVSNPPYIKAGTGRTSTDPLRNIARSEVFGTLTDLVRVSAYLIGGTGTLCFIYPVKRYGELMAELKSAELKVKRVRFIHSAPGGEAIRFLVEARQGNSHEVPVTEEPIFL